MEKVLTVSAGFIRRVCDLLVNEGLSLEVILDEAEIKFEDIENESNRLPHQTILNLWQVKIIKKLIYFLWLMACFEIENRPFLEKK